MLAYLMVAENYSTVALSEYADQLVSSVEVIGAVLVMNGICSLNEISIAMNISTRIPSSSLEGSLTVGIQYIHYLKCNVLLCI